MDTPAKECFHHSCSRSALIMNWMEFFNWRCFLLTHFIMALRLFKTGMRKFWNMRIPCTRKPESKVGKN